MQLAVTAAENPGELRWMAWVSATEPVALWQRLITRAASLWLLVKKNADHPSRVLMETDVRRPRQEVFADQAVLERHLEAIIQRDRLKVLKVLMGYVKRPEEAEDLAQDVFVKVLERLQRGHDPSQIPSAWVMRVTVNLAVDRLRSAWFRRVRPVDTLPEGVEQTRRAESPERTALQKEQEAVVLAAIRQLPVNQRTVVMLFYFHDQRIEEIAEVLGIQAGAVKTRLFRGRERLKELLSAYRHDEQFGEDDA